VSVIVRSPALVLVFFFSFTTTRGEGPSERARALYDSSIVLLAHTHNFQALDLERMRRAGITGAVLKLTVDGIDFLEEDQLPALVEKRIEARYSDDDIRKILGGNLIALYGSVWKR
jgi:hypothetical protein